MRRCLGFLGSKLSGGSRSLVVGGLSSAAIFPYNSRVYVYDNIMGTMETIFRWKYSASRPLGYRRTTVPKSNVEWESAGDTLDIGNAPPYYHPLIVFVNTRSGPQVGEALLQEFYDVLHPLQVVALPEQEPLPALQTYAHVPNLRVAIVGGDGTVAWVISCIETLQERFESTGISWPSPPIAVMPVGTGNDLAQCLGWSSGYSAWKDKGVCHAIYDVMYAEERLVDRWKLQINAGRGKSEDVDFKYMINYIGIGVDAKVAMEFHEFREAHPEWFQSQIGNKLMYAGLGALDVAGQLGDHMDLSAMVRLQCDGETVSIPSGCQGLLIVNIESYMGGMNVWKLSEGDVDSGEQCMQDKKVEVVAVYGSFHLGTLMIGLSRAVRIAQASQISLSMAGSIPMQVDGEPFLPSKMNSSPQHGEFTLALSWHSSTKMLSPNRFRS